MAQFNFQMQWPRDNLFLHCFVHELVYYRYHWHPDEYELNILLCGRQDFCYGSGTEVLEQDDVLLVSPGTGHASFGQTPNTRALVIQFSAAAFKPFVKKGFRMEIEDCRSTADTRNEERFRLIRFYAAQILDAAVAGGPYAQLRAKAAMELLLVTLCTRFSTRQVEATTGQDEQQEVIRRLTSHMEQHYTEKLTLEDLAQVAQYNRTYISTLFKNTMGINFHEHLTRIRFQHALTDLATTDKNLTQIAMDNGFSDLKSLNKHCKATLNRTPAEYRLQLGPDPVRQRQETRLYISADDPLVREKITRYLYFPETGQENEEKET